MMTIKRSLMNQLIIDKEGPLIRAFPRWLLERSGGPYSSKKEKGRELWREFSNKF